MNIYKNLLFMHGFVLDPKILADVETDKRVETGKSRAEHRGNRTAAPRALPSSGRGRQRDPVAADLSCAAGGCG